MSVADRGVAYVLPIRTPAGASVDELTDYLRWLAQRVGVVVVDGSDRRDFASHAGAWEFLTHVPPSPDLRCANGKVWGVLTGLRYVRAEAVIIADDDVRYTDESLRAVARLLQTYDVVRPQNFFDPLPWHARWDTARTLLNRVTGGDWPGTLGVRRSVLAKAGGYDGECLFENLELVRTVKAAGGREIVARDLYVRRLPPTTAKFLSQRVRQAYDEMARPARLAAQLSLLPLALLLATRSVWLLAAGVLAVTFAAEIGRRRWNGGTVFPWTATVLTPGWLLERAICAWIAVASRLANGGVRYSGGTLSRAATPERELRQRITMNEQSGVRS